MVLVSLAYAAKSEDNISTAQGCGPQILSAFVKQRTYHPLPTVFRSSASFQDIQENVLEASATFGSRRLEELQRNISSVMIHLRVLKVHLFPAGGRGGAT
jgi:hypothetical protein